MRNSAKHFIAVFILVLVAGSLYLLTIRGTTGNPTVDTLQNQVSETQPFELSPERGRFAHVVSLGETKQFQLGLSLANFVYPDVGWYSGRFYSFFAPGLSYMALPFYTLGKQYDLAQVFTFGFISLISILSLITLFFIARNIFKLPIWAAFAAVLIFGFGSTAWSYAITFYQHQLTAFFILTTFYSVWKYRQRTWASWLYASWVWLGYALAITIDYPNVILLLPVMVYFLISAFNLTKTHEHSRVNLRTSFVLTSIFFILITGLHLYHNQIEFGSWKRLSGSIVSYKGIKERNLETLSVPAITQAVAQSQEKKGSLTGFFSEQFIPNSFGTLLFSTDRGLFFYGPIFLLALLGILLAMRNTNIEYNVLMSLVTVNVFLYSSWGDPWGGWAYGTRYLIPSMSILALFVAFWLSNSPKAWISRIVAVVLFAYSSAIALLGAVTTNAVPPRIEADFLHTGYNYFRNITYLQNGKSGSFFYNTYAHNYVNLFQYFEIIYWIVLCIFTCVVFLGPLLKKRTHV